MIPTKKQRNPAHGRGRKRARRDVSHFQFPWSLNRRLRRVSMGNWGNLDEGEGGAGEEARGALGKLLAPIVAGLGKAIGKLFSGTPSQWKDAGPGVHDWFTNDPSGSQQFLDWMRSKFPTHFGSVDEVKSFLPLFYMTEPPFPRMVRPGDRDDGPAVRDAYKAMGVDFLATHAANPVPNQPIRFVMLPGAGTPSTPQAAVDAIKDAASDVAAGRGTEEDRNILDLVKDAAHDIAREVAGGATEGANAAGGVTLNAGVDVGKMLPWLVGGILVIVMLYMVFAKPPQQ
jgi:hypothetical protein